MVESTTDRTGNRVGNYIEEVREELRKVIWPTREASFRMTVVVLFLMLLSMIVIFAIDTTLSQFIEFLLNLGA